MREATLKFKTYAGNIHIIDNSDLGRRMLHFIIVSFGVLALFYIIILGNITFNIIERKSYEADARTLSNEVVDLELTYLQMSEKVDESLAKEMGFKEAQASITTEHAVGSIKFANNGF